MMTHVPAPVFAQTATRSYDGTPDSVHNTGHRKALELGAATISLVFNADSLPGEMALVTKDRAGASEGQFQILLSNGLLYVELESDTGAKWLKVPNLVVSPQTDYHLSVSFGEDGMMVYVNGQLAASEPTYTYGIAENKDHFLIGGSLAHRESLDETPHSVFKGNISGVTVHDVQLSEAQVGHLAHMAGTGHGHHATMSSLAPVFEQMHHGSDWLKDTAESYGMYQEHRPVDGVMMHGPSRMLDMLIGTPNADTLEGDNGNNVVNGSGAVDDGIDGLAGNDLLKGWAGDDVIQGGYGNDTIEGGRGNDILMGGHGEDILRGGAGDDWLISIGDAREQMPYNIPGRDERDPYNELTNGKVYADQPIPGDDVMEGGWGADIFYFQTVINAKERYIEKHTNDNGVINWHGVAGENDNLHDHWVDMLGNDVVLDYRFSEGDRIVIEGHTTYVDQITYGDENGDGVLDYSLIELYSDQGNGGGAHHLDRLGTIKVYGEAVKYEDLIVDDDPAYGIVHDIAELDEAIAPAMPSVDSGPLPVPANLPKAEKLPFNKKPVLSLPGEHELTPERGDYIDIGNPDALDIGNATFALRFELDWLPGNQALIAKDLKGNNAGDFSVWSRDGQLWVRQETGEKDKWLKVPDLVLTPGQEYHLAVSFGEDGMMVYLDGELAASEPTLKQGLFVNENALTIGATRASRDEDDLAADGVWGTIEDVHVFRGQLPEWQIARLAGHGDAETQASAQMALDMAALAPVLEQTHHGSDWLMMTAANYGMAEGHGHGGGMGGMGGMNMGGGMDMNGMSMSAPRDLNLFKGTPDADTITGDDTINGSNVDDGIMGFGDDDLLKGWRGDDVLQGNYGNDTLEGGIGNDILDGGHGEDVLRGGSGDDWLISIGDAREPKPYNIPDRDEGDPYNELTNGQVYPDQPIPGDDVLEGGGGADIFYFQTVINAKERYIEKHTNDAGVINWHGVAGENDNIHDHWVDKLGNDVILDYRPSEGDQIVIEGHTTYIDSITYGDQNNDGVYDFSLIQLYSDQGRNGGAHHLDRLGTIKVYGELVKESDIIHTASPAYGIVHDIAELREAITPAEESVEAGRIRPPKNLPDGNGLALDNGDKPVLGVPGTQYFDNDERSPLVFAPDSDTSMANGTISMSFSLDEGHWQTLFTKDASGAGHGHIALYVEEDGDLVLRLQEIDATHYYVAREAIELGVTYDVAVNFGKDGAALWLDGVRMSYDVEVTQGLGWNNEHIVVGASAWSSTPGTVDRIGGHMTGTITDFAVYDRAVTPDQLASHSSRDGFVKLPGWNDAFGYDMQGDDLVITRWSKSWTIDPEEDRFLEFRNITVAVDDVQVGNSKDNQLIGEFGADILRGKRGNDRLEGHDNDDFLRGDAGNDSLYGGDGKDRLTGGADDDYLDGGDQDDRLLGEAGYDELKGNDGDDWLKGGIGDDTIYGSGWGDNGADETDTAVYDGNFADYSFVKQTFWNGTRGENYDRITITDSANGGRDGIYEGRDYLIDIDRIIFADQTVEVSDLVF